jgi:threonine dehydrogenase-like Zn-dependent dehydrogenase
VDGAPVVLECSGRPEAIQQTIDLARPGGRVALLGIAVAEVTVIPVFWITREITVSGSINSRQEDFEEALRLLAARPEVARIVTRRIALSEVPATFEALLHPSGVGKVVIDPRLVAHGE